MPLIQIRDVPEAVRDELARKAAAAGQSMQAYLLGELTRLAERPSMAEIVRALAGDSTMTSGFAVPGRGSARSFLLFSGMAESLRKGWLKRKSER